MRRFRGGASELGHSENVLNVRLDPQWLLLIPGTTPKKPYLRRYGIHRARRKQLGKNTKGQIQLQPWPALARARYAYKTPRSTPGVLIRRYGCASNPRRRTMRIRTMIPALTLTLLHALLA